MLASGYGTTLHLMIPHACVNRWNITSDPLSAAATPTFGPWVTNRTTLGERLSLLEVDFYHRADSLSSGKLLGYGLQFHAPRKARVEPDYDAELLLGQRLRFSTHVWTIKQRGVTGGGNETQVPQPPFDRLTIRVSSYPVRLASLGSRPGGPLDCRRA